MSRTALETIPIADAAGMDPWQLELIVVRSATHGAAERRALSRDVDRELLIRIRPTVYVERAAFLAMKPEDQHIVRIRALAAVAPDAVFSHWSAAVLHGLPAYWDELARAHITVDSTAARGHRDVLAHVTPIADHEIEVVRGIRVTTVARTVIDIAATAPKPRGVAVADGALRLGIARSTLEVAIAMRESPRGARRAADVVAFAHPGGEGANESESRWTMFLLGIAPQELQWEIWDDDGLAGVADTYSKRFRVAGEADGARKYLDPALARAGAGRAVYDEKRREDRMRAQVDGLARWGYAEGRSTALLGPILFRAGLRPEERRPTLADWAAAAKDARPRRPRWRVQP